MDKITQITPNSRVKKLDAYNYVPQFWRSEFQEKGFAKGKTVEKWHDQGYFNTMGQALLYVAKHADDLTPDATQSMNEYLASFMALESDIRKIMGKAHD